MIILIQRNRASTKVAKPFSTCSYFIYRRFAMDDKISAVVAKLQQRLGDDYEVRIVDVTKNNDTVKKGISVRKNGEKIGRIYYWNGEALEAFLDDVESSPLPDIDFVMSLKKQKDNIVAILINAEANKERLKSMTETLNDMMKESQDIVEDILETLFILSNETRQFGAICMLYPEVLKKFCVEKMIDNITKNNIISKYCMITESRN